MTKVAPYRKGEQLVFQFFGDKAALMRGASWAMEMACTDSIDSDLTESERKVCRLDWAVLSSFLAGAACVLEAQGK